MSDERPPEEGDPEEARALSRRRAEDAMGDLSRMGIDPRSLGLEPSAVPPQRRYEEPETDDEERAPVVPLRPTTAPVAAEAESEPTERDAPLSHGAGPLGRALGRAGDAAPVARQTPGLVRSVSRGLVTPDAAVAAQSERELIDHLRVRQTDRRIVTFISGKGGVGTTTVAVGVGTALTALREDRSAVLDVQVGTPSLGRLLGLSEPLSVGSVGRADGPDAPTAVTGLSVLDGTSYEGGVSRTSLAAALDVLGADHAFQLLDAGNDTGEGSHSALARADTVVVVTGPGRTGAAALETALDRIDVVNPAVSDRVLRVVVCPYAEAFQGTQRELAHERAGGLVVVPPDPYLQAGQPYDPEKVAPATREAMLRVAAVIAASGAR